MFLMTCKLEISRKKYINKNIMNLKSVIDEIIMKLT
jgi:hypothetical protein